MNIRLIKPTVVDKVLPDDSADTLHQLALGPDDLLVLTVKEDSLSATRLAWEIGQTTRRQVLLLIGDNERVAKISARTLRKLLK